MSKWSLVESKKRNLLVSLPLILILALSFISVITLNIPKVNAYSPQFYYNAETLSVTGSTLNWNTAFAPAGTTCGSAPVACKGLIFAITIQSFPYTAISSITDNVGGIVSTNDTYTKAACTVGTITTVGECIYYAVVNTVHTVTFLHIIINFATSCVNCNIDFLYSNQPMALQTVSVVPLTTRLAAVLSANIPKLDANVLSNTFTLSGSQQFAVLNAITVNDSSNSVLVNFGVTLPLVTLHSQAPIAPAAGAWDIASTNIDPAGGSSQYQFSIIPQTSAVNNINYSCGNLILTQNCTSYIGSMVTVIFVQSTIQPPSCQNCGLSSGSTIDTTTTFTPSMPNETLLYTYDSPIGGASIQNIFTEVASYTNAGAGKNIDFIYICIYELSAGTLQSATPISSANQLKQANCILSHSISTGQTNQIINWNPNVTIPPSTTWAISIMSRFAGLSIYAESPIATLYGDTSDYTGTAGVPPIALSNFFISTPQIYLGYTGSQSPIITTATDTVQVTVCISGGTCTFTTSIATTTITSISTSLIYTLSGANGAVANIQDLTLFLPVWVLPLVMGALFGVIGLLFGGVVGLGMGVMLGIIPLWFAFLLGLGIVFILFKRVI